RHASAKLTFSSKWGARAISMKKSISPRRVGEQVVGRGWHEQEVHLPRRPGERYTAPSSWRPWRLGGSSTSWAAPSASPPPRGAPAASTRRRPAASERNPQD